MALPLLEHLALAGSTPKCCHHSHLVVQLCTKLIDLSILLSQKAFQARIANVSSNDDISKAISSYLTEDLKADKDITNKVVDEAKAALGVADSGLPAAPRPLDAAADVESVVDASHPVLIKDVHAWKASMQISTGVRPVRNLEEFVDVVEKL